MILFVRKFLNLLYFIFPRRRERLTDFKQNDMMNDMTVRY